MTQELNQEPAGTPAGRYWLDKVTVGVIGGFSLLAVLVLIVMWPGYREYKHQSAANNAYFQGDYAKAIAPLEWLAAKHPQDFGTRKRLGEAYLHAGRPQDALEQFQHAARINGSIDLNEEFGIVYTELKNDKKAMEYFDKVLAKKPDSPGANYYLGVKYFNEKKWFEAAKCFQAAAGNEIWDKKAASYRRELSRIVLGAPAEAAKSKSNG